MAAPNIIAATTIRGKTAVQIPSTTLTDIITNAAASGKVLKVNLLMIANANGSSNGSITACVYRSSTAYYIAFEMTVPAGATLDLLSQPLYLEEGDSLQLKISGSVALHANASYEDIS